MEDRKKTSWETWSVKKIAAKLKATAEVALEQAIFGICNFSQKYEAKGY